MDLTEKYYWLAFDNLPGIGLGPKRIFALLEYFGNLKTAWEADKQDLLQVKGIGENTIDNFIKCRSEQDLELIPRKLEKYNIKALTFAESDYPEQLKHLKDIPLILYFKGNFDLSLFEKSIGIVGSRQPTDYAIQAIKNLSGELSEMGFTIISGMALGIDAAAHKGVLSNPNGKTVGVLANGADKFIPYINKNLYESVLEQGLLISEYKPETMPEKGYFPARNRIIAALSQAVLIGEAAVKSGALITAERALELKKPIFGLAGIPNKSNEGINFWIRKGLARLITSADDIIEELDLHLKNNINPVQQGNFLKELEIIKSAITVSSNPRPIKEKKEKINPESLGLNEQEKTIYNLLTFGEFKSIDKLFEETELSIAKINSVILTLQLKKLISRNPAGAIGLTNN
jgi:DNA processing protein